MKIWFKKIQRLFKHLFGGGKEGEIHVYRDWAIIVAVWFFINACVVVWGLYGLFINTHTDEPLDVAPATTIDRAQLKSVLERYEQKQIEYDAISEGGVETRDPSR